MASVWFEDALILSCVPRVSKSGNQYVLLQFLDNKEYQVYDLMQFEEHSVAALLGIQNGVHVQLGFVVVPERNGGVRLALDAIGAVNAEVV